MNRRIALAGAFAVVASGAVIAGVAVVARDGHSSAAAPADAGHSIVTVTVPNTGDADPPVCVDPVTTGELTAGSATAIQRAAATRLIDRTRAAIRPYERLAVARQRGFRHLDGIHWYNPAFYVDDRTLDPSRPEFLLYDGERLLGAMYVEHGGAGPQIGGPLTVWHTHCPGGMPCLLPGDVLAARESPQCTGRPQVDDWMLHVWLVPNQLGPFGHQMVVPRAAA